MSANIIKAGIIKASGSGINPNMLRFAPRSYNTASYNAYQFNMSTNMTVGQKYTIQLWNVNVSHTGKTSAQLGVNVYWGGGMNSECSWSVPTGHADYLVATFTAQNGGSASDSNNLWLNIYNSVPNADGTRTMSIGKWKLEAGSVATSYIINTNDYSNIQEGFVEAGTIPNVKIFSDSISASSFIEI